MSRYKFSLRSLQKLEGVHPELAACVVLALKKYCPIDFAVTEGERSLEKQKEYVAKGTSQTMNSHHLEKKDGFSYAVDLVPYVNGKVCWDRRDNFEKIKEAMFAAAKELDVTLRWGGDWDKDGESTDETFYDGPHFELQA